ncbi:MAG: hypothetical protein ACI9YT_000977 [Halobacteriales archaeon]|jgi:hypothetical protein
MVVAVLADVAVVVPFVGWRVEDAAVVVDARSVPVGVGESGVEPPPQPASTIAKATAMTVVV